MIRGLYTAASAMMMDVVKQDTISNNLANINTTGYKKHTTIHKDFEKIFISRLYTATPEVKSVSDVLNNANQVGIAAPVQLGYVGTGSQIDGSYVDHSDGALRSTDNKFDLALRGKGFFVVETPGGFMYTRNGAFTLNDQGELVTHEGHRVVGENGPIKFPAGADSFTLSLEGNITVDGEVLDRLQIVDFEDYQALVKVGSSFYTPPDSMPVLPGTANVEQGQLEVSNVDLASEMVQMITALRSYEINQKAIQTEDEMMGRAISDVGRPVG